MGPHASHFSSSGGSLSLPARCRGASCVVFWTTCRPRRGPGGLLSFGLRHPPLTVPSSISRSFSPWLHVSTTSADGVSRGLHHGQQPCSALCMSLQAAGQAVTGQGVGLSRPSHFVWKQVGASGLPKKITADVQRRLGRDFREAVARATGTAEAVVGFPRGRGAAPGLGGVGGRAGGRRGASSHPDGARRS